MTYRELLRTEHPGMLNIDVIHKTSKCPDAYWEIADMECCEDCKKCWDTEVPESETVLRDAE